MFRNTIIAIIFMVSGGLIVHQNAYSADHVDAPLAIDNPQADITDVYAFLDPNDESRIVVALAVNPLLAPEDRATGFSPDVLYQFKFDNTGDGIENYVVQATFTGTGFDQNVQIVAAPVTAPVNVPLGITPVVSGDTQEILSGGGFTAFAGLTDDAFVTDFGQFQAILSGSQDVFRAFTSPILGELRGRETEGIDFFADTNVTHIVVSFPKELVRGTGFFPGTSIVGIWATTSIGDTVVDRMGQQLFNTVFVPSGMKDEFNMATPAQDVEMFSGLLPDALTQEDNDGTNNTIAGRAAVLELSGFTELPNGAPLILPPDFEHPLGLGRGIIRAALLPDVIRLDLDLPAAELAVGVFGLQNGRRPQDNVLDIGLLLLRQLADVKFPDGATVVVGDDEIPVPGSGPLGERAALDCSDGETFPQCTDRRVLAVLQGTDFNTPDSQIAALNVAISGNDRPFPASGGTTTQIFENSVFPFMPIAHAEPVVVDTGSGCSLTSTPAGSSALAAILMPALLTGFVLFRRRLSTRG